MTGLTKENWLCDKRTVYAMNEKVVESFLNLCKVIIQAVARAQVGLA